MLYHILTYKQIAEQRHSTKANKQFFGRLSKPATQDRYSKKCQRPTDKQISNTAWMQVFGTRGELRIDTKKGCTYPTFFVDVLKRGNRNFPCDKPA